MFEVGHTKKEIGRSYQHINNINIVDDPMLINLSQSEQDNIKSGFSMREGFKDIQRTDNFIHQRERKVYPIWSPYLKSNVFETHDDNEEEEEDEEEETGDEEEEEEEEEDLEEGDEDEEEDEEDEDEEDHSDASSENSDFLDKLDEYMNKFRMETDNIVNSNVARLGETNVKVIPSISKPTSSDNSNIPIVKPVPLRNPNSRRNSMLPGSEMCNEVLVFNSSLESNQNQILNNETSEFSNVKPLDNCDFDTITDENLTNHNDNSPDLMDNTPETTEVLESIKELKILALNNEANQTQMKKIETDLEEVYDHILELHGAIILKSELITDIIKNYDVFGSAKLKFENKSKELKKRYDKIGQLLKVENAKLKSKQKVDFYKNKKFLYENRLVNIEELNKIIDDSVRTTSALFFSIVASENQAEELKKQIAKGEKRKKELEEKLAEDQKKIHELEEKCNVTAAKLKEMQSESEDEKNNGKSKTDKQSLLYVSAKISHLDHVLKEKSMDLERTANVDEKETLRSEIHHLRRTRDRLVDEKCDLDEKFQKEKTLSVVEERKLLEFGETIEAIDAMIEHKNEMICGRKGFDESQSQREKGERMLMEKLAKLSDGEMRTLFYKYFLKVIDLKESSRNLEIQAAELENHIEAQEWRIQTLTNALKLTKLEAETRIVTLQKDYQQKLHLMFKHFSEETSSSDHERLDKDSELAKYKRENKELRKLLNSHLAVLNKTANSASILQQGLKQIASHSLPPPKLVTTSDHNSLDNNKTTTTTTKVTRQRNKLIIQKTTDNVKRKK